MEIEPILLTCALCDISTYQVVPILGEDARDPFLAFVCGSCAHENQHDESRMRERIRMIRDAER